MLCVRFPFRYPRVLSTVTGKVRKNDAASEVFYPPLLAPSFRRSVCCLAQPAAFSCRAIVFQRRLLSTSSDGAYTKAQSTFAKSFPIAQSSPFLKNAFSFMAEHVSDFRSTVLPINLNVSRRPQILNAVVRSVADCDRTLRISETKESPSCHCLTVSVDGELKLAAMAFEDPERDEGYYLALNPSYFFCDGNADEKKWFAIDLSILWNKLKNEGWNGVLTPNGLAMISDLGEYVSTLRVSNFRSVLERFVLINSSQVFPHCLNAGSFRPQISSRATLAPAVLRTDFRNPAKISPKFEAQITKDEEKKGEDRWKRVEDLPSSVLSCYPTLITGPSGSGKSVAAHQLTELFVERLKTSVFSVCVLSSHLMAARENTTCRNLFSSIAIAVVETIRRSLQIFGDYPRNVDGVFMHCILDEMGSHPEWVYAIVSDSASAAAEINRRLQLAKFEGSLTVHFTIVGTGVGRLPGSVGSIGLPYWRLAMMTKPEEAQHACFNHRPANRGYPSPNIFDSEPMIASIKRSPLLSILSTNMRCAVIIAQYLCEFGYFASDLSPVAAFVAKHTAEDYMQMNAWGASGDNGLQEKYISLLVSLLFTQRHGVHILEDEDILKLYCGLGAMEDLLEWGDVDKGVCIPNCDSLFYASASSGKGRVVPDNAAPEGGPEVGGRFKLLISKPSGVTNDVSGKAKSKSFPYFRKPQGADAKEWDTNTHIRFAISPAVALVALLRASALDQVSLFSSDSQMPSVTYERLCSLTIRLLLGALEGADIGRFPASMLFTDRATNQKAGLHDGDALDACVLERIRAKNKLPHAYLHRAVQVSFDEVEASSSRPRGTVLPISVKTLRSMKFGRIPTRPFVVEEAPPLGAQNDLLMHSASTTVGVEQKLYTEGSVRAIALIRRACQMGYDFVEFTVPFIDLVEAPVAKKKHKKGVSFSDEEEKGGRLFVSKAVRLFLQDVEIRQNFISIVTVNGESRAKISIGTRRYRSSFENSLSAVRSMVLRAPPAKAALRPAPADMVVLCSPQDTLLPDGCAVEFVGKLRVSSGPIAVCDLLSKQMKALRKMEYAAVHNRKNTVKNVTPVEVKYTVDKSVRCSVVSRTLSLERLLASGWLGAVSLGEGQKLTIGSKGWHSCRYSSDLQLLTFNVEKDHFLTILPATQNKREQNRISGSRKQKSRTLRPLCKN